MLRPSVPLIVLFSIFLGACGGVGSKSTTTSSGPGSPPGQNVAVTVASSQVASGIDIQVTAPVATPAPNAQFLGVGGNSAFGTGAAIHQGQTATVFLFGDGLTGDMQVSISGPGDITVSNTRAITATDKTPGIAFTAVAAPNATLGGRTVLLTNTQKDITAFTGGLEVIAP